LELATTAFESYAKENLPKLLEASNGSKLSTENYTERRDTAYGKLMLVGL